MDWVLSSTESLIGNFRDIVKAASTTRPEPSHNLGPCPDCRQIFRKPTFEQLAWREPPPGLRYGDHRTEYPKDPPLEDQRVEFTRTYHNITTNSASGCSLCLHLLELIDPIVLSDASEYIRYSKRFGVTEKEKENLTFVFYISRLGFFESAIEVSVAQQSYLDIPFRLFLWFSISTHPDNPAARYVPGRDLIIDPASEECFAKFRKALSEDDAAHPKTTRQNSHLPRRVIEIISGNLPENFRLRLQTNGVEVENRPPGPYAALSYCWGGPQPLQTTKLNQKERMHDLEFSKLPKTIADAVICTHNLNLKYLWVDSMCIIQDCEEDKSRELGVMAGIYSDAYVTIQAARAPTSTSGFLAPCEPEHISISLPYCCPSDEFGSVTLTPIRGVVPVSASVKQVLDGRGWTFQEMILSPRILVYSNLQLFCKTNADEVQSHGGQLKWRDYGFQTGRRDLSSVERMLRPQHTNATHDIFARPATTDLAIHKSWLQVVAEYSLREISDPHDKLRAISALASRFHDLKGSNDKDTYLAGCWSKTLLVDLSWKLQPHIRPSTRPVEYRAPSWSWASVDGAVSTIESFLEDGSKYIPETERNLKIIDCSTVLNSSNETFGKVSGGRLVIKGRLKRITTMLKFLSISQMDLKTKLEGEFAAKLLLNRSSMEAARTIPVATIYMDVDDGFVGRLQQDFNGGGRWCLLLGHLHSEDADSDMAYGLVLAKQSDGFYRRIGSFLGNGDNTRIPDPYTPRKFLEYFRACPLDTITII